MSCHGSHPVREFVMAVHRVTRMAVMLTAVILFVGCQQIKEARLRAVEADLASVLANSNAKGMLTGEPELTGDGLFDAYCEAVALRFAFDDADDKELDAALVPDEILASWERQFGADPRYWELRYCLASCSDFEQSADGVFLGPTDFLREAQVRGIATANTLLLLHLERSYEYDQRFNRYVSAPADAVFGFGDLGPPDHLPIRPDLDAQLIEKTMELHRQQEHENLEILDKAVAAGSDEAWPLYLRAMHWLELGEVGVGLTDLAAGNIAPRVIYPQPFPISAISAGLAGPHPLGGPAVSGAVMIMAEGFPQREYTPEISLVLDSLIVAGLSGDTSLLNSWQAFLCRSSTGRYNGNLPNFVALYLVREVADYWETEHATEFSGEQLDTLRRVRGAVSGSRQPINQRYIEWYSSGVEEKLVAALGDRGHYLAGYFAAEMGYQLNRELFHPVLTDISVVSYPGLASVKTMGKYPPLTIEEARRRRDAESDDDS